MQRYNIYVYGRVRLLVKLFVCVRLFVKSLSVCVYLFIHVFVCISCPSQSLCVCVSLCVCACVFVHNITRCLQCAKEEGLLLLLFVCLQLWLFLVTSGFSLLLFFEKSFSLFPRQIINMINIFH